MKPVYVKDDDIFYNSKHMVIGKLYKIDWRGEKWALRNNGETIDFMRKMVDA